MKPIGEFLDEKSVEYAVVGSVAGLSHGYGRATIDVDVLVNLPPDGLALEFEQRFQSTYFVDAAMIRDAVRWKRSFNLYHFETGIKIDIFIPKRLVYDFEILQRRSLETMDDETTPAFYVQSAEDLVLSKLAWYREGNHVSDRQWSDILAVLKLHTFSIDLDYLEKWAPRIGVQDLLEKAFDNAGYNNTNKNS